MTLHDACRLCPKKLHSVCDLLHQNVSAVLTPQQCPMCGYHYPLHIAICRQASLEVLQVLVDAGPSILLQEDGPHHYTPLCLALALFPHRVDLHTYLLLSNKTAIRQPTSHTHDLPLHVACKYGVPIEILVMLIMEYPESSNIPNQTGQTPRDIIIEKTKTTTTPRSRTDQQEEILQIFSTLSAMGSKSNFSGLNNNTTTSVGEHKD